MADNAQTISFIDVLRQNRAGALLSGLIVMVAVALVLSAAVPDDLNTLIAVLLVTLLAMTIGFVVKVTSPKADAPSLLTAGSLAAIGVPIMFGAGGVWLAGALEGYNMDGLSFDQSILLSLFNGFFAVGSALAAVVAIIVAAWGARSK